MAAADIHLTPDDVAEFEAAMPVEQIAGGRYSEAGMAGIDR